MDVLGHAVGEISIDSIKSLSNVAGMHWSEPLAARDIREVDLPELVTSNRHVSLI